MTVDREMSSSPEPQVVPEIGMDQTVPQYFSAAPTPYFMIQTPNGPQLVPMAPGSAPAGAPQQYPYVYPPQYAPVQPPMPGFQEMQQFDSHCEVACHEEEEQDLYDMTAVQREVIFQRAANFFKFCIFCQLLNVAFLFFVWPYGWPVLSIMTLVAFIGLIGVGKRSKCLIATHMMFMMFGGFWLAFSLYFFYFIPAFFHFLSFFAGAYVLRALQYHH